MAEGRFYSDLELTEREIERMVMEASRSEYLAKEKKLNIRESSTSGAEPSSSAASKATLFWHFENSLMSCQSVCLKMASFAVRQLVVPLDQLLERTEAARTTLCFQTLC
jgi:hypothetical protein